MLPIEKKSADELIFINAIIIQLQAILLMSYSLSMLLNLRSSHRFANHFSLLRYVMDKQPARTLALRA